MLGNCLTVIHQCRALPCCAPPHPTRFYVVWVTDCLHEMLYGCRAFGFGRRRDNFDPSRVPMRGFTPDQHAKSSSSWDWRSRYGHETSNLLALSFNPLSGTVRAFSRRNRPIMPSADFYTVVRTPCGDLSPEGHNADSRSKPDSLHRAPPDLQNWSLMDMTSRFHARSSDQPACIRFCRRSRFAPTLPSDSPRVLPLRFASLLHLHQVHRDFHPNCRTCPTTQDSSFARAGAAGAIARCFATGVLRHPMASLTGSSARR